MSFLLANWPAAKNVIAGVTTRCDGVNHSPYANNNLALHVGDNADQVKANRFALDASLPGIKTWQWLEQVHGVTAVKAPTGVESVADACYTDQANVVCAVLTADCLPVLLCNKQGNEVAAIHAGWRGLCAGVIENTVMQMASKPEELLAWFGPAIGPAVFEVGEVVYQAFVDANCDDINYGDEIKAAFTHISEKNKFLCNIYQMAVIRLRSLGVSHVYGGQSCTMTDKDNFYSYRRKKITGRMASFIYFS